LVAGITDYTVGEILVYTFCPAPDGDQQFMDSRIKRMNAVQREARFGRRCQPELRDEQRTSGGSGGTVRYEYDESGHLVGEYAGSGALIWETVWLGDNPVATLRPNGSSVSIYYVHAGQLNTPRQVTRPSDNVQMWTWFSDPFGADAANSNPGGAGAFIYKLRFPGQYCCKGPIVAETGHRWK